MAMMAPQPAAAGPGPAAVATSAPMGGSQPAGGAPQFASLYVGDLDEEVTEAMLYEIFNTVGPVASIRVCRDSVTRKSLGYAYVNFHSTADAERVMDTLNYSNIKGRCCRIMWSHRDPNLRKTGNGNVFVKNLDKNIDNKALYDTFSLFGNILSCKVATDMKGESKGYGFVHYETHDAAKQAIEKVNNMQIGEKTVYVGEFLPRENRTPTEITHFTNIYVKNFPLEWDQEKINEEFGKFGTITSSVIQKDKKERAFAFLNFEKPEEAQACIKEMHKKDIRTEEEQKEAPFGRDLKTNEPLTELPTAKSVSVKEKKEGEEGDEEKKEGEEGEDGKKDDDDKENEEKKDDKDADEGGDKGENDDDENKTPMDDEEAFHPDHLLWVSRAMSKSERENVLKQKFQKTVSNLTGSNTSGTKEQVPIGVNLYIKNLPDDWDDVALKTTFQAFGEITSARVMVDGAKRSKGFGFVCYKTPDEATKAVSDMHLKTIKGKPLYVGLAEKRDERTQRLVQRFKGEKGHPMMGANGMVSNTNGNPGNGMGGGPNNGMNGMTGQMNGGQQMGGVMGQGNQLSANMAMMAGNVNANMNQLGNPGNMMGPMGAMGLPNFPMYKGMMGMISNAAQMGGPGQAGSKGGLGANGMGQNGMGNVGNQMGGGPGQGGNGNVNQMGGLNQQQMVGAMGNNVGNNNNMGNMGMQGNNRGPGGVQNGMMNNNQNGMGNNNMGQNQGQNGNPMGGNLNNGNRGNNMGGNGINGQQNQGQQNQMGQRIGGPGNMMNQNNMNQQGQQQMGGQYNQQQMGGQKGGNNMGNMNNQMGNNMNNNAGKAGNVNMGNNNMNNGQNNMGLKGGNQQNMMPGQQGQNNQQQGQQQGQNNQQGQQRPGGGQATTGTGGALTAQQLAQAPPGMQKQMLGEKLYPAVSRLQPDLAGKITGMMLEMDNTEVLQMLDSDTQLRQKVDEAVRVLQTMK